MPWGRNCVSSLLSLALAVTTLLLSGWTSRPWCDELTFLDSAVNFLRSGVWHSEVFYLVNNPLYPLAAASATVLFGASHFVVVSVGVLFAFLASVLVLRSMRRRGAFGGIGSEIAFVALFWTVGSMVGIITNGRPDTMVLFLTVLLIDGMFPADGCEMSGRRVFFEAYLLMLAAAYTLPLCCVFSAAGMVCAAHRRKAFVRTALIVGGGICAWLTIAAFYAWQCELVRFIGFYATFNSITGQKFGSFAERVLAGYAYDFWTLGIHVSALAVACVVGRLRGFIRVGIVILLIPLLMTVCGRYQPYYGWLFSVPSFCFAVAVLSRVSFRVGRYLPFVALVLAACLVRGVRSSSECVANRTSRDAADAFVMREQGHFGEGATVVVADDTIGNVDLYYPLLSRKTDLWFRGKAALTEMSDERKFEVGLALFVKDEAKRKKILACVLKHQRVMGYLPKSGVVVFNTKQDFDGLGPIFQRNGRLSFLASDGVRSLYSFCRVDSAAQCRP